MIEYTYSSLIKNVGLPVVLVDAYHPRLTSLVVNSVEGAYQVAKCLIEQIESSANDGSPPEPIRLQPSLIVRRTISTPPPVREATTTQEA